MHTSRHRLNLGWHCWPSGQLSAIGSQSGAGHCHGGRSGPLVITIPVADSDDPDWSFVLDVEVTSLELLVLLALADVAPLELLVGDELAPEVSAEVSKGATEVPSTTGSPQAMSADSKNLEVLVIMPYMVPREAEKSVCPGSGGKLDKQGIAQPICVIVMVHPKGVEHAAYGERSHLVEGAIVAVPASVDSCA